MRAESLLSATDRALVLTVGVAADKCRLARAVFSCEAAKKPTKTVRRDVRSTAMLQPAEVHTGEYTVQGTHLTPDAPSSNLFHVEATVEYSYQQVSVAEQRTSCKNPLQHSLMSRLKFWAILQKESLYQMF